MKIKKIMIKKREMPYSCLSKIINYLILSNKYTYFSSKINKNLYATAYELMNSSHSEINVVITVMSETDAGFSSLITRNKFFKNVD